VRDAEPLALVVDGRRAGDFGLGAPAQCDERFEIEVRASA
jgi:hypothetical protein